MFLKIVAGIVMGIIAGIVAMAVAGLGVGGGTEAAGPIRWAFLIAFLLTLFLAVRAARARFAWSRGALITGLLCFMLPLAGFVFSAIVGHGNVVKASTQAEQVGAAIGSGIGGVMVTGVTAVLGFFGGLIFLIMAYFLGRARPVQ